MIGCCRDPGAAAALAADWGGASRVQIEPLDVRDAGQVAALVMRLATRPIDVLLNVAGTMGRDGVADDYVGMGFGHTDYGDWLATLEINLFGPLRVAEALVERVAASERRLIVNLTSVLGSIERNTVGGLYAYRSSKAALNAITRSMAIDLAPRGIQVLAIHPGWVRTDKGGPKAALDPADSVRQIRRTLASVKRSMTGRFLAYDGTELPW